MGGLPQENNQCPMLREFIHENAGFLRLYAENAQNYCEAADDIGLSYAVRKMVAHIRVIAETARDLKIERERLLAEPRGIEGQPDAG
jgi:hypothetical protein